jgi:hypothetical protein
MLRLEHPEINGGRDRYMHKSRKLKVRFKGLLAKYQTNNKAKSANRSNNMRYTRSSPKHTLKGWNRQREEFHAAGPISFWSGNMTLR